MSSVDLIKERLNIADVVGGYVKLERAGTNFRARCPFHTEKTPSFFVSPARGTFHCFGCNKGGDIFTFVEEVEGLDFPGTLKLLAERAGVEIPKFGKKEASEEENLRSILEVSTIFFQKNLALAKEPIAYLYGRGLVKKSLEQFRLGFAPEGFTNLRDHILGKGFLERDAERAGMLVKGARGYHDRFRCRIMFPLFDSVGRVVGFTGRIFGDDDGTLVRPDGSSGVVMGKYVNTPETPLYHKSRILYGYDRAKDEIRKSDTAVLVEGQMDLIMAHQAGTSNAIAVSGTAFSDHHAAMISRLSKKLILALDADTAGQKASERAAGIAFARGVDVFSAELPEGKDPADIVKENVEAWKSAVSGAKPTILFLIHAIRAHEPDMRSFRRAASERVIPLLARMENKIDQAHFAGETARELGVPEESVWEEIARVKKDAFKLPEEERGTHKEEGARELSRAEMLARHIESIIFWQEGISDQTARAISIDDARVRFREFTGREISDSDREERAFEAELYFSDKDIPRELGGLFSELFREKLKERLRDATEGLRQAEFSGDRAKADLFLAECGKISKEIAGLGLTV